MTRLALLLPGDPATPTGGYVYDRRIAAGLRTLGWEVRVHALDASFPDPTPAALAGADAALAALPDGERALIDGLALGAMPEVAARHARRLRLAALVHHPLAEETGLTRQRAAALRERERRALAVVGRVVVTSPFTARLLADYGVPAGRVRVVEPGTDPAPAAAGSAGPGLALLCVAALTPRKDHALLLDALAGLADRPWHLTLAGSAGRDPATANAIARRIRALALGDRVTLTGTLDDTALAALYHESDLFVLPTRFEGYGMALAEALARGLPVISTGAGAVPDTVPPEAGILVPPGDARALGAALARVMDDPALRRDLAAGALAARGRLPSWDAAAARMAAALADGSA